MSDDFDFDTPWSERVQFSDVGGGFAYAPNKAILRASVTDSDLGAVLSDEDDVVIDDEDPIEGFRTARGTFDVVRVVASLRASGFDAQPDHVFFAHDHGCCCGPHPALVATRGATANPRWPHSVSANPVWPHSVSANPVWPHPVWPHPVWPHPVWPHGPRRSTARPAAQPAWFVPPPRGNAKGKKASAQNAHPHVVVLDTGLAAGNDLPPMLRAAGVSAAAGYDVDVPDMNHDRWLDPAAGHGTFIAGVIERIAPGCRIEVHRVIGPQGDATESAVVAAIDAIASQPSRPDFLSLSFGGPVWDIAPLLTSAVLRAQQRGVVVVASAGNEGTCRPSYPAAIPGVVSVGAVGPTGPAPFTNYGPWVRACAPGVDVVSAFFESFDGPEIAVGGYDSDRFRGWASWSGTSFSAPAVVGALVREMRLTGCTPAEAVKRVVDAPWLARIANLGTVVNV